ncbi:MAG TPA: helix-turn-helix transcriptional regulator [Longimicrobiales bacterium]|nr:helix-turn-helix transcriptional regulator [Longimicrobiales bacterium]
MAKRRPTVTVSAQRALRKLGSDIRAARKRRRLTVQLLADRALISPTTLGKIERGDPGTAIGFYASVLMVLGLADRLGALADVAHDELGSAMAEEQLPQRVRYPAKARPGSSGEEDQ